MRYTQLQISWKATVLGVLLLQSACHVSGSLVWTTTAPANLTQECSSALPDEFVMAAQSSSQGTITKGSPFYNYNEAKQVPSSACPKVFKDVRTWTVSADGESVTAVQGIQVKDTQPPTINGVPADVRIMCDADIPMMPDAGVVTVSDTCDARAALVNPDPTESEYVCVPDGFQFTRTWDARDCASNTAASVQTLTIYDDTPPTWDMDMPASVTLECTAPLPAAPADVTATDNCDGTGFQRYMSGNCAPDTELMSFSETKTADPMVAYLYSLNRTWVARDYSGNAAVHTQIIKVVDSAAPALVSGTVANATIACGTAVPAAPVLVFTDACDTAATVQFTEQVINRTSTNGLPVGVARQVVRTWVATDKAGNKATMMQVITVTDNEPPVLSLTPADITLECQVQLITAAPTVTATDACSPTSVTVDFAESIVRPDIYSKAGILRRTWSATDTAGNKVTYIQNTTVIDTTPPAFKSLPPATVSYPCASAVPAPPVVNASDLCDRRVMNVTLTTSSPAPNTILRTWTTKDSLNNIATFTQTITITDTTAPVLANTPANVTISCSAPVPPPANVTASDNCPADVNVTLTESSPSSTLLLRTWTATDGVLNTATYTQAITVSQGMQLPIWSSYPSNATLECSAAPLPATPVLTATGTCSTANLAVDFAETKIVGATPADGYVVRRTWTASTLAAEVENRTIAQDIAIKDTQAPTFQGTLPAATLALECGTPLPAPANLTAVDACSGPVDVQFAEVKAADAATGVQTVTRTWTAVDAAGNNATFVQVITMADTTKPVFSGLPTNLSIALECGTTIPAIANVTALDACSGPVTVSFTQSDVGTVCAPTGRTLTRTWTATDPAGNTATFAQTITITDTQAPVLLDPATSTPYANATALSVEVSCSAQIPAAPAVQTHDLCNPGLASTFTEVKTTKHCKSCYTLTRTWTASDACGRTALLTQAVTVTDTAAPRLASALTTPSNSAAAAATPDACLWPPNSKYFRIPATTFFVNKVISGGCSGLSPTATAFASCKIYSAAPPTGKGPGKSDYPIWPPSAGFGAKTGSKRLLSHDRHMLDDDEDSATRVYKDNDVNDGHNAYDNSVNHSDDVSFDKKVDLCFWSAADQSVYVQAESNTWYDRVYVIGLRYFDACNNSAVLGHTVYVPSRPVAQYTWWTRPLTCQAASISASRWKLLGVSSSAKKAGFSGSSISLIVAGAVVASVVAAAVAATVYRRRMGMVPNTPRSPHIGLLFGMGSSSHPGGEFDSLRQVSVTSSNGSQSPLVKLAKKAGDVEAERKAQTEMMFLKAMAQEGAEGAEGLEVRM